MKAIITGTGRCGTGYMAKVFTESGVKCGHEMCFRTSGYSNRGGWEADSSWMAIGSLPWDEVPVILVYRNPTDVVNSLVEIGFFDENPDPLHLPYIDRMKLIAPDVFGYDDPYVKAQAWYVFANQAGMAHATLVESIDKPNWKRIAKVVPGLDWTRGVRSVPKNVNTRRTGQPVPKWERTPELTRTYAQLIERTAGQ